MISVRSWVWGSSLIVAGLLCVSPAFANKRSSAADLLLKGTKQSAPLPLEQAQNGGPVRGDLPSIDQYKLDDPFSVQLFSVWQSQKSQLPPEVNHWINLQLKSEFEAASHLWGGIEKQLPPSFALAAKLAHLRALLSLGLFQTTVESWVQVLAHAPGVWISSAKPSPLIQAFDASWSKWLGKSFDQYVFESGFSVPADVNAQLSQLNPRALASIGTLSAAGALRKGDQGRALLEALPSSNFYKLPLAHTVSLGYARKGDLGAAAQILKIHAESALEAQGNLLKVSSYLLQIARFLFQAGLWDEAEGYFRKIPTAAPEFLSAREELAWVLLRKGDVQNLRGEVASLSTAGTRDSFHPELPVVRAISNLKLCSFGAVQRDFGDFQDRYGAWAQRIESALNSSSIPAPFAKDSFTLGAEKRAEVLSVEASRLGGLHTRSLESGLPSVVGRQSHWKLAHESILNREQAALKQIQVEYRRQWKNQKALLSEAIRKLRFVKVELMNQMRVLAAAPATDGGVKDAVSTSQAAPRPGDGRLVFPLDGVLWPDEFFRIQGVVEQRCLKGLAR
ncbi:MAG: hypothetical protein KGQ59_09640 [Bdellovibrionales bacterium]|nr:hypothetical protein [Bdellovibrionales bacterium]